MLHGTDLDQTHCSFLINVTLKINSLNLNTQQKLFCKKMLHFLKTDDIDIIHWM